MKELTDRKTNKNKKFKSYLKVRELSKYIYSLPNCDTDSQLELLKQLKVI